MHWVRRTLAMIHNLLRRRRVERELDEEVQSYAQLLSDENVARGLKPQEARRMARIAMGGVEQVKEEIRSARTGAGLEAVWQDLRYGARMLRKKPGFTAVAVITLALGVGANSAIFSVMNASLLASLPVPAPDRVTMIWTDNLSRGWHGLPASAPDYLDWKASGIFKSLAAFDSDGFNLRIGTKTDRVEGMRVTPEWFQIQQVKPYLGRLFQSEDVQPGRNRVVVLAHSLWISRFGADPKIAGRSAVVNGQAFTIIGVLPQDVLTTDREVFYLPFMFDAAIATNRGDRSFLVLGRLADGLSLAAAQQRISDLSARMGKLYPQDAGDSVRL